MGRVSGVVAGAAAATGAAGAGIAAIGAGAGVIVSVVVFSDLQPVNKAQPKTATIGKSGNFMSMKLAKRAMVDN